MNFSKLYRKRLIPMECILLKDDIIEYCSEDMLITSWKTLNPKIEFSHGCSCYFFQEGFKISKFYKPDGQLLYYYCDIVEFEKNKEDNSLIVTDLLADVIIYPDGRLQVMDLDELADAQELIFCWMPVDGDLDAVETEMICRFREHYGSRPFANLTK